MNTGRFQPGHTRTPKGRSPSPRTQFKVGHIPWSQGRRYKSSKLSKSLKASYANGNRIPWNIGKPWPDIVKKKIGDANRGRILSTRGKKRAKRSAATRLKNSNSAARLRGNSRALIRRRKLATLGIPVVSLEIMTQDAILRMQDEGKTQHQIAQYFGVARSTVRAMRDTAHVYKWRCEKGHQEAADGAEDRSCSVEQGKKRITNRLEQGNKRCDKA